MATDKPTAGFAPHQAVAKHPRYSRTGYKRVYASSGSYYYVDPSGRWHRLCRVEFGEAAMLRELAKVKRETSYPPESMLGLIESFRDERLPAYAESTQADYGLMLLKIQVEFKYRMVADVTSHDVMDLRDKWKCTPRSANKYQALLSILMAYAIEKRLIAVNPCRDVTKLRVKKRKHYMRDDTLTAIRNAAVQYRSAVRSGPTKTLLTDEQQQAICQDSRTWRAIAQEYGVSRSAVYRIKKGLYRTEGTTTRRCPNGEMYACIVDLAYLTALRAKDCRLLKWSDVTSDLIYVVPTKTESSSDVKLEIAITPAIRAVLKRATALGKVKSPVYVFHTLRGGPISASALKSAWRRARERAGIQGGDRFRDLRPKALSDAKRRGLSLEALRDAAGHTNVATTEGYLRGFEVKRVNLSLETPPIADEKEAGG